MRVGLDVFSLHPLKLDPFGQLDWIHAHGLAGAQFGNLGTDLGKLREIRGHADARGLYSHVSVTSPNPHIANKSADELVAAITREVEAAAVCGWHELHSILGDNRNRWEHAVPWPVQLEDSIALLRRLAPVLRLHASRINLEPHADTTTFELVRIAEAAGPDICGVCLDTANVLVFAEDPVAAARRVAPFTHLTHAKDGILFFGPRGLVRQGRPPGAGVIDWSQVLPLLHQHAPDLPLSIEDHKWLFGPDIFDPAWHQSQADLTRAELAQVVALAWGCQRRIHAGELPDPAVYEQIPYADEMESRLTAGRDHLNRILAEKHLNHHP